MRKMVKSERRRRRHREPAERPKRQAATACNAEPTPRLAPQSAAHSRKGCPVGNHSVLKPSRTSKTDQIADRAALLVSGAIKRPQPHEVAAQVAGTETSNQLRPHRLHCQN